MKKTILVLALSLGFAVSTSAQGDEAKKAKERVAAMAIATTKTPDVEWIEIGDAKEKEGMGMFKTAIAKAKKEDKLILTFFTSSVWCLPCRKIHKELLHSEEFKNVVRDEFVLIKGDFKAKRVKDATPILKKLMKMFNKNKAVPCFTVIDNNGKVMRKIEAYNKPQVYVKALKEALVKHKAGK